MSQARALRPLLVEAIYVRSTDQRPAWMDGALLRFRGGLVSHCHPLQAGDEPSCGEGLSPARADQASGGLNRLLVSRDRVERSVAREHPDHLLGLLGAVVDVTFDREPSHVRRTDEVLALEQGMVEPGRLMLPYIAGCALDRVRIEGV